MSIGHIRDKGSEAAIKPSATEFKYSGSSQKYTILKNGLYKLEVWGASGGLAGAAPSSKGGYSAGYKILKKGTVLYICNGGVGKSNSAGATGGYNGGGNGRNYSNGVAGGGGGATHIALVDGTLKDIGYDDFVANGKGLIVAGGAGGSGDNGYNDLGYGGTGGGVTGGDATGKGAGAIGGTGGTQSQGGNLAGFGYGGAGTSYGSYGIGGGGGGLYGGGVYNGHDVGGGGGSGYIAGVPEIVYKGTIYTPSTSNGVNEGNGKATITYIG